MYKNCVLFSPTGTTVSTVLVAVTALFIVMALLCALGFFYWQFTKRHMDQHQQHLPYSVHSSSRNKLADDLNHIEKTNNETNENRLWRFNNSIRNANKFAALPYLSTPPNESPIVPSSDPNKLASLGIQQQTPPPTKAHSYESLEREHLSSSVESGDSGPPRYEQAVVRQTHHHYDLALDHHHPPIPAVMKKVQNADMERNTTPQEVNCKSIQKAEINVNSLPLVTTTHGYEKSYRSDEVVV